MLRGSLSEEKKKRKKTLGKSRCRWWKGQLRVPQQRTRSLKMKRKMAGGGNSFGESPGGKGRGQSETGPYQKEERKKHRLRQFPAEIPVGIASHFFFLNLSKIVKPGYIYHLKFLLEASSSSP